jgi:SAM-dependent methyltransferase
LAARHIPRRIKQSGGRVLSAELKSFDEQDSDFYDQEYFLNLEARYLSGAIQSRVNNIMACIGPVAGKRILDLGCGSGYFVAELSKRGAEVTGVDYAAAGIRFGRQRFPDLDLRQASAYELQRQFEPGTFDVVVLLDVIEHMFDHERLMENICYVAKPGGRVVISTDADGCVWEREPLRRIFRSMTRFSADGRAKRLIDRIEARRPRSRRYVDSHINEISGKDLQTLLGRWGFSIVEHRYYPMVGVPIRDVPLQILPRRFRGEHQCIAAVWA